MNGPDLVALSAAGERRREEILGLAGRALTSRRRRRSLARAGALAAPPLIVVAAIAIARPRSPAPREVISAAAASAAPALRHIMFQEIATKPGIAQRAQPAGGAGASIELLTDAELLQELHAAGRTTGMIRTAGRVVLTTRVAANEPNPPDDEPAPEQPGEQGHG